MVDFKLEKLEKCSPFSQIFLQYKNPWDLGKNIILFADVRNSRRRFGDLFANNVVFLGPLS